MASEQLPALISACISFAGLLLVVLQLRESTRQRSLEALYQIYDVNRELLTLGFCHPELFQVLSDEPSVDPQWERRYLQLWLNQLSLIYSHLEKGSFDTEFLESLKRDIRYMMTLRNMQRHWSRFREFYPASFQRLVERMLQESKSLSSGGEA
jgi:hypothetical protein